MKTKKIIDALRHSKKVLITTHVNPDPDALSSEIALALFLKSKGKQVTIVNAEPVEKRYRFISGTKMVKVVKKVKRIDYDVAVVLDCGEFNRVGSVAKIIDRQKKIINIDHHITSDHFGDLNLVIPQASSTCEILFCILKDMRCKITPKIASNLYLGIMTDTGSFRYENTTPLTHIIVSELMKHKLDVPALYRRLYESSSLQSLNMLIKIIRKFSISCQGRVVFVTLDKNKISKIDTDIDIRDEIFKFFRKIKKVDAIAIFTEISADKTRINLRSKTKVDVAKLASYFGGGGHRRASGCVIPDDVKGAQKKMLAKIRKML